MYMNPLLKGINPLMKNINQIKQMWQMLNGNPQAISRMMENNPNIQKVKEWIGDSGGDAEKAFRQKAKEMGIDADEFINALK